MLIEHGSVVESGSVGFIGQGLYIKSMVLPFFEVIASKLPSSRVLFSILHTVLWVI